MKERDFGLDLVRCLAMLFVICVHYFLNIGFYKHTFTGEAMFVSLYIRWIFFCCVPLFIILTGYLKRTKKLNKKYYKGIIHILLSYIVISVLCLLFRKYYLSQEITLLNSIIFIGNYSANEYAWYIEMYLGLFLLIPFLNILYEGLKTKKNKQYLILSLALLVSISPLINYIKIDDLKLEIIPKYWNVIYPFLYYFIGCYISEYKPKIKKIKWLIILLLINLIQTIIVFKHNYKQVFDWQFFGNYNALFTVIISTLLFLLIYDIKCSKKPIKSIIKSISIVSLDMYLFSWIIDKIVYPYVLSYIHVPLDYLKYFIIVVTIVFVSTYILALIKKFLFWLITLALKKILKLKKKCVKNSSFLL